MKRDILVKNELKRVLLILAILGLGPLRAPLADTIYLKDNKKLEGTVDRANSDPARVAVRTALGVIRVPRGKILKIEQQTNVSYAEASGDLAIAENKPAKALALYQKALESQPANQALQRKIEEFKKTLKLRDQQAYGSTFNQIEQALSHQEFDQAIAQTEEALSRIKEDSARERVKGLAAQAHIGMARKNTDSVNYQEAETHYKQAIDADPDNPTALLELADLMQISPTSRTSAIPLYQKGIEMTKRNPGLVSEGKLLEYRYKLGQLHLNDSKYDEAAELFLAVAREDKSARFPMAIDYTIDAFGKVTLATVKKQNAVIASLRSLIQIKRPHTERAYLLVGRIYYDRKDWSSARDALTAAVQTAPTGSLTPAMQDGMYFLGICLHKLGDRDQAVKVLQNLLSQRGSNYEALCELADIYREQMSFDEALKRYDQAIALDRDRYRAYLGKGLTVQRKAQPDYEQARENFKEVMNRDSLNIQAQTAIARAYFEEKNWDKAISESQKLPDLLQQRIDKAKKEKRKKDAAANKAAKETFTDDQTSSGSEKELGAEDKTLLAEAWTITGSANVELKNTNLARENFDKALNFAPGHGPALEGMALSYKADDMAKQAEKYFQMAITADPKQPLYYLNYGIYWHKNRKNTKKALPLYYKYLELGGKDPNVADWIKECKGMLPNNKR